MAEKRPICWYSTALKELQSGDTLPGGGGETVMSELKYDSGWFTEPYMAAGAVTHGVGAEPDFIFVEKRVTSQSTGIVETPCMGSAQGSWVQPGYIEADGTDIHIYPTNALLIDAPDGSGIYFDGGQIRIRCVDKTPDYDSDWFAVSSNSGYTKAHGIGAIPDLVFVEFCENSDGTGLRVPCMIGSWNAPGPSWVACSMVFRDATNIKIRTGQNYCVRGTYDKEGNANSLNSGYCRIRAWSWTPNYDSDWFAISDSDVGKIVEHGLGQKPTIQELCFSNTDDNTDDVLHMMGGAHYNYDRGCWIWSPGKNLTSIGIGRGYVASYEDYAGNNISATSGYLRYRAWL